MTDPGRSGNSLKDRCFQKIVLHFNLNSHTIVYAISRSSSAPETNLGLISTLCRFSFQLGNHYVCCCLFFVSSTNAYMLMYRQINPLHNKNFVKQSGWSKSLKDLCTSILQEEHQEQNRKEYEKNICKVRAIWAAS